jgi:two-component system chemotaxis response regulator CheB
MDKIRVLVVDDFSLARNIICRALSSDPDLEIAGTAADAQQARSAVRTLCPDVITLDVEMPGLDGLSFLRALLAVHPIPVVMVSALTTRVSDTALRALALGAVDVVAKPQGSFERFGDEFSQELVFKVRAAARARVVRRAGGEHVWAHLERMSQPPKAEPKEGAAPVANGEPILLLGASTGGCEAIQSIVSSLPMDSPPVVCVLHLPPVFSARFAQLLDQHCALHVREAHDGQQLLRGRVYIAPGGKHLCFTETRAARISIVAALLTGMGDDGASGLLAIRKAGGYTVAQDERTSQIFGMPKKAIEQGAAMGVVPLERIAAVLHEQAQHRRSARA